MTRYLVDANAFISAKRNHYRFVVCPGFWDWLVQANTAGVVFSIDQVRGELSAFGDDLAVWAAARTLAFFLPTDAGVIVAATTVSAWATLQAYEQQAVNQFLAVADYWLIAHALAAGWTVVTHEAPAPLSKKKIKIPDVCTGVGVTWTNPFQMLEDEGARFVL